MRVTASIPVAFKAYAVQLNPAAQTRRDGRFDCADKRPLTADELRTYWRLIEKLPGLRGNCLRLHLLAGGQRMSNWCACAGLTCAPTQSPSTTPRAAPDEARGRTRCRSSRPPCATCKRSSALAIMSSPRRRASSRSPARPCRAGRPRSSATRSKAIALLARWAQGLSARLQDRARAARAAAPEEQAREEQAREEQAQERAR